MKLFGFEQLHFYFIEKFVLHFGDYAEKMKYIVCLVDTAYNI